jgi:endo-1,3-1,4-beta-glycanase ExoK
VAISRKQDFILRSLREACLLWLVSSAAIFAQAASGDVVLYASKAPVKAGKWVAVADSTAAGGKGIKIPNYGAPRSAALANPANYFELTFPAFGGTAYHLWIRGKGVGNSINNDSVYVQFSDTVTSSGSAIYRTGTKSGKPVTLQTCTGAKVHGWGWTDNGWCGLGPNILFQTTGIHTLRVQMREDGFSIDQIVLSPSKYLSANPGKTTDDRTILAANLPVLTSDPPQVSVSANPSSGAAPLSVNFTANVTLSSGFVTSYNWKFGDGQTSSDALPSHVYQAPGNYTASVTITDNSADNASASMVVSVSGNGSFSDNFNTGSLDTSKWLATNEPAPGNISGVNSGSFVSSNVDLSQGMLRLALTQQQGSSGVISVGGQLQSRNTYGYGTYEWVMRASSTSSTPNGGGSVVSGQISSGFIFINNSQTEIDFEIEGQNPTTVWMTNWISTSQKQYSNAFLSSPDQGFHHYKFVWTPGRIDFYLDGGLVSTHTSNVPSAPAYIMMNHWGTNSTGWGGRATVGVQRYLYISSLIYTPSS